MIQLMYSSSALARFTDDGLRGLLKLARERNTVADVSGMLLHVDGSFFQVLEGEPAVIDRLFARIAADRRHARVVKLLVRDIEARNFPDWSMGFFDGSGRAAAVPGYRADNGFGDLIGDTRTVLRIVEDFRSGRWRTLAA